MVKIRIIILQKSGIYCSKISRIVIRLFSMKFLYVLPSNPDCKPHFCPKINNPASGKNPPDFCRITIREMALYIVASAG